MTFHELGLSEPIVRAVLQEGYATPTPIQAQAIPEALAGRDVFGCAQTGTGKTGAFALPILHRLAASRRDEANAAATAGAPPVRKRPRALILCPTRELAAQILESFTTYGRNLPLSHDAIFGGVSQARQVRSIRAGIDVLIATPGRLLDLLDQRLLDLKQVEVLVLDEADRMLDMGFINDIRRIIGLLPSARQTLFFSATVPPEIRRLADSILRSPVHVSVARESTPGEGVAQRVYMVHRFHKARVLEHVLRQDGIGRTLVFTRTKHGADKLVQVLRRSAIRAEAIHGNKTQNARTRALRDFRAGTVPVLVATDIASRGIDVDEITHVVNFDMPIDAETYIHRIGRTARAGATGTAISLCDREEVSVLRSIERRTRMTLEAMPLPTLPPLPLPPAQPTSSEHAGQHRAATPTTQPQRHRAASERPLAKQGHSNDHGQGQARSHGHGHGPTRSRKAPHPARASHAHQDRPQSSRSAAGGPSTPKRSNAARDRQRTSTPWGQGRSPRPRNRRGGAPRR